MNSGLSFRSSEDSQPTDIDKLLIKAVAQMRVMEVSEVEEEFSANGGDLEMDTQEAVPVIANVENALQCRLPGIEDLKPGQPVSVRALSSLIERSLFGAS